MKGLFLKYPVLLLTLSLIAGLTSCDSDHHKGEEHIYKVTHPWKQDMNIGKQYVAQIHAIQHIELRAYERGYLQKVYVDEGQKIEKGQKMFQLMPLLMEAEYEKSKAEFDVAKIEYENTKNLAKRKVVSANELALSKARLNKAKAELKLAQTHLDFTTIKAPFDGIMDRFHVRLGSLVEEGELLSSLADNSQMWVYFNVSETDYLNFMGNKQDKRSLPVKLMLANGKEFEYKGKIDTIEADFNNETGNVAFRASFPNPDGLLRHGETGTVVLEEPIAGALVVPQKATFEVLDKKYVYVVGNDHVVHAKEVVVSEDDVSHLFIVNSGISEKDIIIIDGLKKVRSGDKVEYDLQDNKVVRNDLELPVE